MSKIKKKSKHSSPSISDSSSFSSSEPERKKIKTNSRPSCNEKEKERMKSSKSIWDSPGNQGESSKKYDDMRREKRGSSGEEKRQSARPKSSRGDVRNPRDEDKGRRHHENPKDDDRRHRHNRKSPERREEYRRVVPPQRRYDSRNDVRSKRSHSRDKPSTSRRRYNDKEENETNYEWGKRDIKKEQHPEEEQAEKEKPNFGLSGKLTEDTNKVHGIVIKYSEPPEAKKPKRRWRLYQFKGETSLPTLYIHRQSAYLIGRDRKICDLSVDHPSCSKQHAALQYRLVPYERPDGSTGKRVRPYLIDLESANGTFINNKKVDPKKYIELLEKDVIKFGFSSREYVILHESSKDETKDDDVTEED